MNYIASLGWSHGDYEMFSREQFVSWFDLEHISQSPARFNPEKLAWLNAQYLKSTDDARLAALAAPFLLRDGCDPGKGPPLARVAALLKERASTIEELADAAVYFYRPLEPSDELRRKHYTPASISATEMLQARFRDIEWNRQSISQTLKTVAAERNLRMPMIAMPLRVMVTGTAETPSIDATLELIGKDEVLRRIREELTRYAGTGTGSSK
ncbi:MAG: hypothetical protein ACRET7_07600 [Burkholderiales bacterium]